MSDLEDGADDALSDKADTGGIASGSSEACQVLKVANDAGLDVLDDEVGLSTRAATNIFAYRLGPDGTADTQDDAVFRTLAELDAVPYVGPIAFGKLLGYAAAHDYASDCAAAGSAGATCFASSYSWSQTCFSWKPCDYPVERGSRNDGTTTVNVSCALDASTPIRLECNVSSSDCTAGEWSIIGRAVSGEVAADGSFLLEDVGQTGDDQNGSSWRYRIPGRVQRSNVPPLVVIDKVEFRGTNYRSGMSGGSTTFKNSFTNGLTSEAIQIPL